MTSAILLAGYSNARTVARYAKVVEQHYGETYIETGYKPLRGFEIIENGIHSEKPLIQFTLGHLFASKEISDIVIVGHAMLLERALGTFISRFSKPCTIINQSTNLSIDLTKRFRIERRKVKNNSVAGNIIKGYTASQAYEGRQHALFVASDSPFTTLAFIDFVLRRARAFERNCAIVAPAVLLEDDQDTFGRLPLKLVNDSGMLISATADRFGRQGFRASSLLYANPFELDINMVNTAYSLRKGLSPSVQLRVFQITQSLGYANLFSKYFIKRNLSITEVENIASAFFHCAVKIVPVRGLESTYDYDGTERELNRIGEMLRGDTHPSDQCDS